MRKEWHPRAFTPAELADWRFEVDQIKQAHNGQYEVTEDQVCRSFFPSQSSQIAAHIGASTRTKLKRNLGKRRLAWAS